MSGGREEEGGGGVSWIPSLENVKYFTDCGAMFGFFHLSISIFLYVFGTQLFCGQIRMLTYQNLNLPTKKDFIGWFFFFFFYREIPVTNIVCPIRPLTPLPSSALPTKIFI